MKIKTKITYSALKLARNLPKMIDNYKENIAKEIVEDAKQRIDSVNYISYTQSHSKMPQLSDKTLAERRAGTLEGKPYAKPTTNKTPLKYSGRLYNTMKASSTGINIEKYGWYHNIGVSDTNPRIRRPQREFLDLKPQSGKKNKKITGKATREFNRQLKKNFEK